MASITQDEKLRKEFVKTYEELCEEVDDAFPGDKLENKQIKLIEGLIDENIKQVRQEADKQIHKLVEEKLKPKNGEIIKLKRENSVCRMCLNKQQEQIKELQEQLDTLKEAYYLAMNK